MLLESTHKTGVKVSQLSTHKIGFYRLIFANPNCRHEDGWIDCVTAPNVILQIEFLFHPMPLPGPPPQADVPTPEKEKQVMHDCSINLFDIPDTQEVFAISF